ncbi:DNA mismatch repair protein MutT [Spirochaetia bacterium]|nr:DNA mismatch repair protein MutT [Spirochaetia bacterium]
MEASHLIWTEEQRREVYRSSILSVRDTECRSPEGNLKTFTVIDCRDWVIAVPVITIPLNALGNAERQFLLVRQWRFGSRELSLEFPGGVLEEGEDPEAGAKRELEEETAWRPGCLVKLGTMSPNPAMMSNHVHFYLAEDLSPLPHQNLDEDEFVEAEFFSEKDVITNMGKPPYVHALSAAALALYLAQR